ncbi:carboxypeptidase regulatory-like domain-containing protein [Adhaeribacter sp. BT258]|uniref:Carboxypeptidase regulatory-like domain-containing protein n=1 Tax=Adhaeribacter terrigena TaxID=2793070 RepID=A0ABS1C062_9BACT|nr:carboxypeptidase-like regulatory domain-containing protein [Adhaeribacter terrigena]MBK0402562.1 carboxypeptidase regulatory-like domain-containing protein [Adhaeribacter terrigena]
MKNYWFALLCLLWLTSCKELEEINEVKVTGQTLDATTKAPLEGVVVELYEDNDGAFMGKHLLQSFTTDHSGDFNFNFTYKEGPYTIFVHRNGYIYQRLLKDNIFNKEVFVDYQNVESLKNEQHLVFEMDPVGLLSVKIMNTAPALSTDQLTLEIGKGANNLPLFTRTFEGLTNTDFQVGSVTANRYVPIKYTVRENGILRSVEDSVLLKPSEAFTYTLNY